MVDGREVSTSESVGAEFSPSASARGRLDLLLKNFGNSQGGDARASSRLDEELNLSSLDRVELLSALEEKFHVELNETAFANAETVADLVRVLQQPAARRTAYTYRRWTHG